MELNDFKIGDRVVIHKYPGLWTSRFSDNCPIQKPYVDLPFTGTITQLDRYGHSEIGDYGWDLNNLIAKDCIYILNEKCDNKHLEKLLKTLNVK